jgi:two-component system, cell cycle response regulator DivK
VADARLILATIIPTIVILDVRLTDGSGLSLAEEMKADPRMAAILILAVSASVLAKDLEAIRRAGCDAFLAKPFQPRALSAEVARLVRSRQTPSIILGPDPARSSDATPHP